VEQRALFASCGAAQAKPERKARWGVDAAEDRRRDPEEMPTAGAARISIDTTA